MKKTIFPKAAAWISAIWTAVIIFCIVYVSQGERFDVMFVDKVPELNTQTPAASVTINASTELAWKETPIGWKIAGLAMWLVMLGGIVWIAYDNHLGKKKPDEPGGEKQGKAYAVVIIPLLLSSAFLFIGYSSSFSSNSKGVWRTRFDGWVQSGAIEKKGEKSYSDKTDSIKNLFVGPWIK